MSNPPQSAGAFRQLDPGPPPRRQKRICCSSIIGRAFLVLSGLGVAWLCYRAIRSLVGFIPIPHSALYQDLNVPYQPQDVVRPLVDSNQTFDIVATVWLRTEIPAIETTENSTKVDWQALGHGEGKGKLDLEERVVFSDTIFRGLRLKDKNTKTSVTFQVPTEIFKRQELNNYDLRASFVLVPQSPSPLDDAVSYTKWKPTAAKYPPVRPWRNQDMRSLQEHIIDAYGTFIPLLSFHAIQSRCPTVIVGDLDDENEREEVTPSTPSDLDESRERYISTQGKPILQTHPYIITRSFLRVVDVTEIYNREAYDKLHLKIKSTSCGWPRNPDWRNCERSFSLTGNQEVKIKLLRKDDKSTEDLTEWAYAPYLSLSRTAWGPLDLVPVPVNREDCPRTTSGDATHADTVPDEDSVSITWNIAFAGRSPRKLRVADWIGSTVPVMNHVNMTDTAMHRPLQWTIEHAQSVGGHQLRDDYHPRRVMILKFIKQTFTILGGALDVLYWYTRSSTVGISVLGVKFVLGGIMFQFASIFIVGIIESQPGIAGALLMFALNWLFQVKPLMMFKAVTRAELYRYKRWIPRVRFAPETHAERSSQRMDSRTSVRVKITIFLTLATIFSFSHYRGAYIINPTHADMFPQGTMLRINVALLYLTASPAIIMGWILQIILNARMKRFAGMYAICAYLGALEWSLQIADHSRRIVGKSWDSGGFGYFDFVEGLCYVVLAIQALRYPRIFPSDQDEDGQ